MWSTVALMMFEVHSHTRTDGERRSTRADRIKCFALFGGFLSITKDKYTACRDNLFVIDRNAEVRSCLCLLISLLNLNLKRI